MSPVTVVFLDKNRIQWYESRDSMLASLEMPETIMKDLEIVDPTSLGQSVKAFLNQHHITPSVAVLILSDSVTFSQELIGTKEEKEQKFQKFLAAVPFEMIRSRRYTIGEQEIAIAVPRSGFEPLVSVLQGERFPVIAVLPTFMLGPMKNKRWLDAEMGTYVAGGIETIVSESITPVEKVSIPTSSQSPMVFRGINRLTIGIGILVLLVGVLFFLIVVHV